MKKRIKVWDTPVFKDFYKTYTPWQELRIGSYRWKVIEQIWDDVKCEVIKFIGKTHWTWNKDII
jgi:hypothetical protein